MKKKYSKLVLSLVPEYSSYDGKEIHGYYGAFYSQNRDFVMKFDRDEKSVEFTGDENDAFLFTDDDMCTECMEVLDRKSTRLNSSHIATSRMPSSA